MPFAMTDGKEKSKHAKAIIHGAMKRDYFTQFQGASEDNVIMVVPESAREVSSVTAHIVTDLVGDGVKGNADLSTNRDELHFLPFIFKGDVRANSIKSPIQKIMDRTSAGNWRREKTKALQNWYFRLTTRLKFYAFSANCTNVVWGENKANAAALAAGVGGVMSTAVLDEVSSRAKNGWHDGTKDHPELTPYIVEKRTQNGVEVIGEFFPFFIGPKALDQLNLDPVFREEQKAKAAGSMPSNLDGFAGVYKNLVLIEVNKDSARRPGIVTSSSADYDKYTNFAQYKAGDNTETEINFCLGAGAGAMGFDPAPNYDEDPTEDNGRKIVAYIEAFFGFEKVRWVGETAEEQTSIYHDKDYAVIAAVTTVA